MTVEERGASLFLGEKEYRSPLVPSLSLAVTDLVIHWRTGYALQEHRIDVGAYTLSGTARLETERLGVIGDPNNQTQIFSLSLKGTDFGGWPTSDGKIGHTVVLGFSKADSELRSKDHWWIEVHFPIETIERIVTALRADLVGSLNVGVKFAEGHIADRAPVYGARQGINYRDED